MLVCQTHAIIFYGHVSQVWLCFASRYFRSEMQLARAPNKCFLFLFFFLVPVPEVAAPSCRTALQTLQGPRLQTPAPLVLNSLHFQERRIHSENKHRQFLVSRQIDFSTMQNEFCRQNERILVKIIQTETCFRLDTNTNCISSP